MKKFEIDTGKLAPALKKIGLAINKNSVLPILGSILIKALPNEVVLISTDLEVTIYYRIDCECKENFEAIVPFDFLNKVVGLNKNCPLTIESGKSFKVIGPNDVYEFKSPEKVSDFPKLQNAEMGSEFKIDSEVLACLRTALTTTGNNPSVPQYHPVLLELANGKITVASTDGGFMVFSKEFPIEFLENQQLLLSAKVIKVLEGCETAIILYQDKSIRFTSGDITIINTRSELKFVSFRKVFPPEWPSNISINRNALLEALGKCSISADSLRTTLVDFSTTGEVKLLAEDGMIKINVSVPGTYSGSVLATQVNSDKLIKLLHQVDYPEIDFAIHDKNRAIVLSSKEDAGYLAMIMPIALAN